MTDDEREALLTELAAWRGHTGDTALANLLARAASALSGLAAEKEKWRIRCAEETIAWADEATENRRLLAAEPQGEPYDALTIPRPHVPYGPVGVPEHEADADYLDHAAHSLEGHYEVGGSNVRATVVKLLRDTSAALRAGPWEPIT